MDHPAIYSIQISRICHDSVLRACLSQWIVRRCIGVLPRGQTQNKKNNKNKHESGEFKRESTGPGSGPPSGKNSKNTEKTQNKHKTNTQKTLKQKQKLTPVPSTPVRNFLDEKNIRTQEQTEGGGAEQPMVRPPSPPGRLHWGPRQTPKTPKNAPKPKQTQKQQKTKKSKKPKRK